MIQARSRDWDRRLEEGEEKLNRAQDESEEQRRRADRVEKLNWELRKQIEEQGKSHERQQQQLEKVLEGVKNEVREKEREIGGVEVREGYAKQELLRGLQEQRERYQEIKEELEKLKKDLEDKGQEIARIREENILLKATVAETDKSREIIIREMNNMKEVENGRIRDIENRKNAELKLQEKIIGSMKREKNEVEQRVEDLLTKHDIVTSRNKEEHHNTVKYFENQLGTLKF